MSRYITFFDESTQTIGTTLAGWTHRTAGTAPTYTPKYGTPAVKRRYLEHKPGTTSDLRGLITWDTIDADANRDKFDLVTCLKMDDWTGDYGEMWARVAITGTTITDGYRIRVIRAGGANNIRMDKRVASVTTTGIGNATVTMSAGKSYFVRFQGNGTALKCRVWDAALGMVGEPSAWDISITDAGVAAAGYIGLASVSSSTSHVCPFNFFAVGTNGDAAICPRTNAERTTALKDQTKEFIVLAELQFAKYDSSGSPYVGTGYWYISTGGYTSAAQDTPANQPYPALITRAPTIRRSIDLKLTGEAKMSFGEMKVANPGTAEVRYQNYALKSETFDASGTWVPTSCTVTASATTPPRGAARADKLTQSGAGGRIIQTYTAPGGVLIGVWVLKQDAAAQQTVILRDHTAGVNYAITMTWSGFGISLSGAGATGYVRGLDNGWVEIVIQTPAITAGNAVWQYIYGGSSGSTSSVFVSKAQLIYGSTRYEYFRTDTTAADFTYTGGALDDVLRMRWNRSNVIVYYGCPDWPKHDFFKMIVGRLGMPVAENEETIRFPISDLSDFLNGPVQTKFTSGDYSGQYKPKVIGRISGKIEPPETDKATHTFTLSDGAIDVIGGGDDTGLFTSDNGVANAVLLTISAVNAGTDTLSTATAHGLLAGAEVIGSGLPAPLATATVYYVASAGLTTTDFRLEATRGGGTINITGGTTGGTLAGYNKVLDRPAGTVKMLSAPVGRVLMAGVQAGSGSYVDNLYADVVFTAMGLSLNYKDAASFAALNAIAVSNNYTGGLWLDTTYHTGRDVLNKIAVGTATWYGFTPDGVMQVGMMSLPAATAVRSFTSGDILQRGARIADRIRAIDFSSGIQSYAPWYVTRGPMQVVASGTIPAWDQKEAVSLKSTMSAYSYGAAGIPLDSHPDRIDADKDANFDFILESDGGGFNYATALRTHLVNLFKCDLGVFEFAMRRQAMECELGETVSIEYDRLGFKAYTTADPPSPDNVAAFDARLAVVREVFIDFDDKSGFPVKVQVYRKIPGYYPTANLN